MNYAKRICDDIDKIDSTEFGKLEDLFDRMAADAVALQREQDAMLEQVQNLVNIINSAGLLQLSRGVELGQTSWYVKASDSLASVTSMLASMKSES